MARRRRQRSSKPTTVRKTRSTHRVEVLYQKKGPYMYGALYVIDGSESSTHTSGLFHISKSVAGKEIIYGSIANDLRRVWDLLVRYNSRQRDAAEQAAKLVENKNDLKALQVAPGRLVTEFPEHLDAPDIDRFIHERESEAEDALILCSVHLRTILELFSGRIKPSVPVYDNQDNEITTIKLKKLMDTMLHHRYFVITGQHIVNLQSHKDQLIRGDKLGHRVDIFDVFDAIRQTIENISVNDVIGVVRSKLRRLSEKSKLNDIVFVVQNIHALSHIVEDRMTDPRNAPFLDFLLGDAAQAQTTRIANAYNKRFGRQPRRVDWVLPFRRPSFELVGDLARKEIEVACWIDGKTWEKGIPYIELFKMMTEMYGDDPVFVPKRSLFSGHEDALRSEAGVEG